MKGGKRLALSSPKSYDFCGFRFIVESTMPDLGRIEGAFEHGIRKLIFLCFG